MKIVCMRLRAGVRVFRIFSEELLYIFQFVIRELQEFRSGYLHSCVPHRSSLVVVASMVARAIHRLSGTAQFIGKIKHINLYTDTLYEKYLFARSA